MAHHQILFNVISLSLYPFFNLSLSFIWITVLQQYHRNLGSSSILDAAFSGLYCNKPVWHLSGTEVLGSYDSLRAGPGSTAEIVTFLFNK